LNFLPVIWDQFFQECNLRTFFDPKSNTGQFPAHLLVAPEKSAEARAGRVSTSQPQGRPVILMNPMKKNTISIDDEIYRRVRTRAAERDTSVSALVKRFLITAFHTRQRRCTPQ
jgi:hypothetical protein